MIDDEREPWPPLGLHFFAQQCPACVIVEDEGPVQCVGLDGHEGSVHYGWLVSPAYNRCYFGWKGETDPTVPIKVKADGIRMGKRLK